MTSVRLHISFRIHWLMWFCLLSGLQALLAAVPEAWPPPAPIALQAESRQERIDGMDTRWLELTGQNFKARWFPGGDWFLSEGQSDASLAFVQRVDPSLQMRLFLYPATGSLPDFDESSLQAYAASIPVQFPGWKLADAPLSFEEAPLGGLLLLDAAYRKVSYQLVPKNGVAPPIHVCELLSILEDGRLFVLRFVGSDRFIRVIEKELSAEIGRFMLE